MSAFDNSKLEQYKAEAKAKWGNTAAYQEYEKKDKRDQSDVLMAIFAEVGQVLHLDPASAEAQALVDTTWMPLAPVSIATRPGAMLAMTMGM